MALLAAAAVAQPVQDQPAAGLSLPDGGLGDNLALQPAPRLPSAVSDPSSLDDIAFERGGASWYGLRFHQRSTASGERYNMGAYTAAHRTLPFGTKVCVHSLINGREVLVRINDRGPHAPGRIIDLSKAAADMIGLAGLGIKEVALSLPAQTGRVCGG